MKISCVQHTYLFAKTQEDLSPKSAFSLTNASLRVMQHWLQGIKHAPASIFTPHHMRLGQTHLPHFVDIEALNSCDEI